MSRKANTSKQVRNQNRGSQNRDDERNETKEMHDKYRDELNDPFSPTNTLSTFSSWDLI